MTPPAIRRCLFCVFVVASLASSPHGLSAAPPPLPRTPPEAIQRWQDMRFGMFIHWGPVSLTGEEISWSRETKTPIDVYDNLYRRFNPTKFDADKWVAVAKAAGVKYIVLTAKHHDDFCLWDTKQTDYNIMHSPFARDVVKELAAACRKQGMAFRRLLFDLRLASSRLSPRQTRPRHAQAECEHGSLRAVHEGATQGTVGQLWADVARLVRRRMGQGLDPGAGQGPVRLSAHAAAGSHRQRPRRQESRRVEGERRGHRRLRDPRAGDRRLSRTSAPGKRA